MPEKAKAKINEWAKVRILELKKKAIPEKPSKRWNYVSDVYFEWVSDRFYLCAKYNCPDPNAISPNFIRKFARLEHIGFDRYQLFTMRHTSQWMRITLAGPSLKSCLETMERSPWFNLGS